MSDTFNPWSHACLTPNTGAKNRCGNNAMINVEYVKALHSEH